MDLEAHTVPRSYTTLNKYIQQQQQYIKQQFGNEFNYEPIPLIIDKIIRFSIKTLICQGDLKD